MPDSYDPFDPVPLLFCMHGWGSSNEVIMAYTGFNDIASEENFIVVYPQGSYFNGTTHWNVGGWTLGSSVDDVAFIDFLIDKSDHVAWEDGTKSERLLLLNSLRKTQPNEALENIESSWGEDDWKHRVEYLKILEYNLSLADEPFLEKCLDEKRKDLRRTAAGLLEKIEGSKLQKRMRERLRDCINLKSRSFKKEKTEIEIELPESCDHGMLRDGIDPKKKWLKGGLKASYFAQMFIVLPPSDWERFFEKKTNEVLDIFIRSEWSELLLQASIVSAVRHQDENWMEEICHIYFNKQ